MEPFWKLSLKAVERVQGNPKEEGNICEISDKCGNKYLVAINRADGTKSVCTYNSAYSIVVVKLCNLAINQLVKLLQLLNSIIMVFIVMIMIMIVLC